MFGTEVRYQFVFTSLLLLLLDKLTRGFSTVTATITVSTILRKYSVHLEEDLNGTSPAGETFAEKVERVTDCTSFIALALKKSKLVFRERKV